MTRKFTMKILPPQAMPQIVLAIEIAGYALGILVFPFRHLVHGGDMPGRLGNISLDRGMKLIVLEGGWPSLAHLKQFRENFHL
jgi:hypothetical protein